MKILIATDGSDFSQKAVEKTCELIKGGHETEIMLVSVFRAPAIATEPFMPAPDYYQSVCDGLKILATGFVEQARKIIAEKFDNVSITQQVVMGIPAQTIVEIAEEWKADLLVVGSQGRGFWSRALLGSVSSAIVNHAPCSVLVVRSDIAHAVTDTAEDIEEAR